MDEATPATPDSAAPPQAAQPSPPAPAPAPLSRWRSRRLIGRALLVLFVVGGVLLFRGRLNVELAVVFEVPPTLFTASSRQPRTEAVALDARFIDADGVEVGRGTLRLGALAGPLTPALPLHVPEGRYLARVVVETRDGQRVRLRGSFDARDEGTVRVELR